MQVSETCTRCGGASSFDIPDDHDGTVVFWECPLTINGVTCGMRNSLAGTDPAAAQVAASLAEVPSEVTSVVDGETSTTTEAISG